jgi:hypothetical protein
MVDRFIDACVLFLGSAPRFLFKIEKIMRKPANA